MLKAFFEGVVLGLVVAMTLGPAFFTIIQTGIDRGFRSAMFISVGVIICDVFLIVLCYLGLTSIFSKPENNIFIGFGGGIILLIYGTYTFLKKPEILKRRSPKYKTPDKFPNPITYIIKGFFLNIANPFIVIFWLTAMGWVSANAAEGKLLNYVIVFFSGTIISVFATDLLKSFIGNKIKKYLRPRNQLRINRIAGLLLIGSGIVLMVRVIFEF